MDQDDDRADDRGPGDDVPAPVALEPRGLTEVAPAAASPVLLVAAMVTTFFVFLNDGFSGESTRWSDLAVFAAYLASGVLGLVLPLVLLLGQGRRRRRGHSTPLVHVVVAAVTLTVGVPALTPAIVLTAPDAAQDLTRRFEPPTVAERHFAGQDAEAELRRIGDEAVRLLGGDPDVVAPEDLTYGYECELENAQRGISWHYTYAPRYLSDLDGRPLLGEGEQQLPGATADLEAVRATWLRDGITGVPSVDRADLLTPEADWLERGHAGPEPTVYLFTVCLVP